MSRQEQREALHAQLSANGYRVLRDLSPTRALHLIAGARQADLRSTYKARPLALAAVTPDTEGAR